MIEVEEGSVAGHLQCQATAYPEANYYWQYNHQIIGNGPRLMLDYGLSRDKTGEYACIAHNQHGNSTARAYINVVCEYSVPSGVTAIKITEADAKAIDPPQRLGGRVQNLQCGRQFAEERPSLLRLFQSVTETIRKLIDDLAPQTNRNVRSACGKWRARRGSFAK